MPQHQGAMSIVTALYESISDSGRWPGALAKIAEWFNANNASLLTIDRRSGTVETLNLPLDPDYQRRYADHWCTHNDMIPYSAVRPISRPFTFSSAIGREALASSPIYNEWFRPQGMDCSMAANLVIDERILIMTAVYRSAARSDFSSSEMERFSMLLPHLQRAIELRTRLRSMEEEVADFRGAFSRLERAVVLVDARARVRYCNPAAQTLFTEGVLKQSSNCLEASQPEDTRTLHGLIFQASLGGTESSGGKCLIRRQSKAALIAQVFPLPRSMGESFRSNAIVFLDRPKRELGGSENGDLVKAQYGLTNAECGLAMLLLSGCRLREAAAKMHVKFTTARTHLAHIFDKVGVSTQADLIGALIRDGHDTSASAPRER
jgi:DNA-binding CsgD family transcriptional regulator/PAS domain-containing protein